MTRFVAALAVVAAFFPVETEGRRLKSDLNDLWTQLSPRIQDGSLSLLLLRLGTTVDVSGSTGYDCKNPNPDSDPINIQILIDLGGPERSLCWVSGVGQVRKCKLVGNDTRIILRETVKESEVEYTDCSKVMLGFSLPQAGDSH
jgi:hypothetical protein